SLSSANCFRSRLSGTICSASKGSINPNTRSTVARLGFANHMARAGAAAYRRKYPALATPIVNQKQVLSSLSSRARNWTIAAPKPISASDDIADVHTVAIAISPHSLGWSNRATTSVLQKDSVWTPTRDHATQKRDLAIRCFMLPDMVL